MLLGSNYTSGNYLIGINILDRSSLAASEMPEIAELGLSSLGRTFVVSANDAVNSGIYAGNYTAGQYVPSSR